MFKKNLNIAVVGATGVVGEKICQLLESRNFPVGKLYPIASTRSAGEKIIFNEKEYTIVVLEDFDFSKVDIAFFSAGAEVSNDFVTIAAAAGVIVIDNTSCFRQDDDIPLVVSEVNAHKISDYSNKNIISNPNCSTMQMLVALKPIHDAANIKRINIASYQSVSGSGRAAIEELTQQTKAILQSQKVINKVYPKQIAFNVIPHIDSLQQNGYTKEEMKMVWETKKILEDDSIKISATAVRVPVYYGHSEAIQIETEKKLNRLQVMQILQDAPGVQIIDDSVDFDYPTPFNEGSGTDDIYVGRIREDISCTNGINLWVVADNVRKGAALNAVQIAEILANKYLF